MTEAADEAVVGIEMVQAFGREDDVRERFGDKAEGVRSAALRQAGVEATHVPGLYYLPVALDRRRRLLRRPRGDRRPSLDRPVRPLRDAAAPARLAARGDRLDSRPGAAGARVRRPQLRAGSTGIEPLPEPDEPAPPAADGPLGVRFEAVSFAYGGEIGRAARPRPRRRAGRDRRRLRVDRARARRRCSTSSPASTTRPAGACSSAASTRATLPIAELRDRRRPRHPAAGPLLGAAAREPHRRPRGRGLGRGARRLRGGRRRRVRAEPPRRLRHPDRRAGRQPLRRPAAAGRARARARHARARRRARRPAFGRGHAHRAAARRPPPPGARRAARCSSRRSASRPSRSPTARSCCVDGRIVESGTPRRPARARAARSPRSSGTR